jgi:hypothetical protein
MRRALPDIEHRYRSAVSQVDWITEFPVALVPRRSQTYQPGLPRSAETMPHEGEETQREPRPALTCVSISRIRTGSISVAPIDFAFDHDARKTYTSAPV